MFFCPASIHFSVMKLFISTAGLESSQGFLLLRGKKKNPTCIDKCLTIFEQFFSPAICKSLTLFYCCHVTFLAPNEGGIAAQSTASTAACGCADGC